VGRSGGRACSQGELGASVSAVRMVRACVRSPAVPLTSPLAIGKITAGVEALISVAMGSTFGMISGASQVHRLDRRHLSDSFSYRGHVFMMREPLKPVARLCAAGFSLSGAGAVRRTPLNTENRESP